MTLSVPVSASSNVGEPLLAVRDLHVAYGGIQAVKRLDMVLHPGELVSLIGANGAGKTTTLKAICGLLKPQSGEVRYQGQSLVGQGPWDLVSQGLVMVPEGRGIFARMTIDEKERLRGEVMAGSLTTISENDVVVGVVGRCPWM